MRPFLTLLGTWTAHPAAFFIVVAYAIGWAIFGDFNWEAGAAIAVWFMTLFIQRAEHRDTHAIQAKLDEIIHAMVAPVMRSHTSMTASRKKSSAIVARRTAAMHRA